MREKGLTTTNIGVDELKYLKKLSIHHGLKQVEFINSSIEYFKKTGINPSSEIETPREAINNLSKRLDEVIRFLQVHEKSKLKPLLERLLILERHLSETYSRVITNEDLKPISDLIKSIKEKIDSYSQHIEKLTPGTLARITKQMEVIQSNQKRTDQLIKCMFDALKNKNVMGKISDNEIKNFEDALHQV